MDSYGVRESHMYFWRVINLLCFLLLLFIFLSLFLNLFLYLTYIFIPFNVGLYAIVDVLILFCLILEEFAKETKQEQFSRNED